MAYEDAKHRPHAVHTGEIPLNIMTTGPMSLSVRLDCWGPSENWATTLFDALQSNWGEEPSMSWKNPCGFNADPTHSSFPAQEALDDHYQSWEHRSGWCRLTDEMKTYAESCFAGKTLQQILEMFSFTFTVDGVTRAFTHEFVRARIGSGFMQHGGRDNDWRHRAWTMPETLRRAVNFFRHRGKVDEDGRANPIHNWKPIEQYLQAQGQTDLLDALQKQMSSTRAFYAALVDAGIPWQDARRILPIGTQTYIHGSFNYVALKGVLANRLEHIMDWEINCVTQLMLRQMHIHCPPMFTKYLGSHSDLAKRAMFDKLESWPPDGKWPASTMRCRRCGHGESAHFVPDGANFLPDERICRACQEERGSDVPPMHIFRPEDTLVRQHSREQMPFFVLHPDSMNGGPVKWLWTNGSYQDIASQL